MDPAQASGWLGKRRSESGASTTEKAEAKVKGRVFRKEVRPDELLTFGKHKGKTFKEALQTDPWYAIWASEQDEQTLPMRRFLKYAEDQGVVQPPKRQKLETNGSSEVPVRDPADAATMLDRFAFVQGPSPGECAQSHQHQQFIPQNPANLHQPPATLPNPVSYQHQQAVPQFPQYYQPSQPLNQCYHPPNQIQSPTSNPCQPEAQIQTQSPHYFQQVPPFHQQNPPGQQSTHYQGGQLNQGYHQNNQQTMPQISHHPNQWQSPQIQSHMPCLQPLPQSIQLPNQYQMHTPVLPNPNPCQAPPPQIFQQNQGPNQCQWSPSMPQHHQQASPCPHPQNQNTPLQFSPHQTVSALPHQTPPPAQHKPHTPPVTSPMISGTASQDRPFRASGPSPSNAGASTPMALKNPALLEYDGSFEVELGRNGFTLLTSKRVSKKAFAIMKSWKGAKAESKKLDFESDVYLEVIQRLRDNFGSKSVKTPPEWVFAMLPHFRSHGKVQVTKKVAHVMLADFKAPLLPADACSRDGNKVLPYQREAVEFALSRGGRVLLADEMGLGKTAQALTLAAQFPKDFPLLVVCPSSLRGNWLEEAGRWLPPTLLPNPERHVQIVRKGSDTLRRNARVIVVSYDLVAQNETFRRTPAGRPYRMVICDEAHYLKSTTSQRSQALRPVLEAARRCSLLTGTPALAKASEIYALLQSLLPGLLPDSHNKFCQRYCLEKKTYIGRRQVTRWEGSRLGDELHAILDMVMVRRFKKDVLNQLPAKRRQRVLMEKLSDQQGVLKELKEKMRDYHSEEDGHAQEGGAPELFRLTGLAKMAAVAEYVQYLVEADCRFLLFAHHQAVMDTMEETLKKMKVGYIRIDGKTLPQHREEKVKDFRTRTDLQVALLSITACGQGLNLQVCSTVVFAELHWTPGVLLQAEDRAHRMGQKESVNVHYLIAKDTLDESMYQMLERKQHDVGVMLDGQASYLAAQKVGPKEGTFTRAEPHEEVIEGAETNPETKGPKQQTLCFKKASVSKEAKEEIEGESEAINLEVDQEVSGVDLGCLEQCDPIDID